MTCPPCGEQCPRRKGHPQRRTGSRWVGHLPDWRKPRPDVARWWSPAELKNNAQFVACTTNTSARGMLEKGSDRQLILASNGPMVRRRL